MTKHTPVSAETLQHMDAYWRASNYLSAGQLYLLSNPLLREKLLPGIIKGVEQPALSRRLGAQLLQLTPAQLQHLRAPHPPAI